MVWLVLVWSQTTSQMTYVCCGGKNNDLPPLYFVLYGAMYAGFMRIIALPLFLGEKGEAEGKT